MSEEETVNSEVQAESEAPVEAPAEVEESEKPDEPIDVNALRDEVREIGNRARTAGLTPLRRMARAYLDNALDAVDGLLGALEGNNRKKGG